jgi:hypothetical protein
MMKRIALLFFLPLSLLGQTIGTGNIVIGFGPAASGGGTTISCDYWESFEFASVTTGNLESFDHYAPTSVTTIHDSGTALSTSASGQKTEPNNPQGTTDTGTKGLAYNMAGGTWASVRVALPSTKSTASAGLWFYASAFVNTSVISYVLYMEDGSSTPLLQVQYRRDTGTTYYFRCGVTGSTTDISLPSQNVWYFVSAQYTASGTCKFRIYDSSGTPLSGSDTTLTETTGTSLSNVEYGEADTPNKTDTTTLYWDNVMFDWTSSHWPFTP